MYKYFLAFAIALILLSTCKHSRVISKVANSLTRDSFITHYEKEPYEKANFVKLSKDSVYLIFLRDFNDSVSIYLNNKLYTQIYINNKYYPYQGAYNGYQLSGIEYKLSTRKKKLFITIVLKNQNKFIEFLINKNYPLCGIDHYMGNWMIDYRKHKYLVDIRSKG